MRPKYLYEPQQKQTGIKTVRAGRPRRPTSRPSLNRECHVCGIKFVDFRNTGRLGCPHDYEEFREELMPLLENIHGETRHCGKTPRRLPQSKQTQSELIQLRKQLLQAVNKEAYEEAARAARPHPPAGRELNVRAGVSERAGATLVGRG